MTRIATHSHEQSWLKPAPNPLYAQSDVLWTEPLGGMIGASSSSQNQRQSRALPSSVNVCFFDTEAQAITASFAEAIQILQQAAMIFNKLVYTSSLDLEQLEPDLEYDEWVDMPPRATQKVVMKARFAGRGEPLAILDSFDED